jgi:hypothetical protein
MQILELSACSFVPEDLDALSLVISDAESMRYYPAPLDRAGVAERKPPGPAATTGSRALALNESSLSYGLEIFLPAGSQKRWA